MNKQSFSVELKLRIDWSDLDYFGHVNNVSFFKYIQAARVNYWECIGLNDLHKNTNIGSMLASCKCDFKRPLFFPGEVKIMSRVTQIKNTSFSIFHTLFNEEGEVTAEATDVVVIFDFNKNEKVIIPDEIKNSIEKLERIL